MRRFSAIALHNLRARPLRTLLTTLGVLLGVAMIFGVLLLVATMRSTFEDLFDAVYGKTDLLVTAKRDAGSLPAKDLDEVRAIEGVKDAEGSIFAVTTLVDRGGKTKKGQSAQVYLSGLDPKGVNLAGSHVKEGRDLRRGAEIVLERNWAKINRLKSGGQVRLATPAGVRRFHIVGLFEFGTGLNFGGQGFAYIPIARAREVLDRRHGFDEIDVAVAKPQEVDTVRRSLQRELGKGVQVARPGTKSDDIQKQLTGLYVILYFFAGMTLFVGSFIIFNSFSMTVLQRMREIGMLRTLGTSKGMIVRSVMREALLIGVAGSLVGAALGVGLAELLIFFTKVLGFPIGDLKFTTAALVTALVVGVLVTAAGALYPAVRAGRIEPIRAVLGEGLTRAKPSPRRAIYGAAVLALGLVGVYTLASSPAAPLGVVVAGIAGVIFLFLGVAMIAPTAVGPLTNALAWPIRKLQPITGRLAGDSAKANPARTAATASALMIGLALVTAFSALGSSFLGTISDEIDESLARDFTVQPRGFNPGAGPQQKIGAGLERRIEDLPGAAVVTAERFVFLPDLPGGGLAFGFDPAEYKKIDNAKFKGASKSQVFKRLERGQVTVGEGLAKKRNYRVGGRIKLQGPSANRRAKIAGIIKTAIFGGVTIGMSFKTMNEIYGVTSNSALAIRADSPRLRATLRRGIERALKPYPQLEVLSNDELKSGIERQVNQQFSVFYAILAMAIIVSLFGIVNTLSMNVVERRREIGVLRALGSSRWQVRGIIATEGLLLSLVGALLGLIVGFVLGYVFVKGLVVLNPNIQYKAPVVTVFVVAFVALAFGLLASVIPAGRAARLNILEAVSYE